MLEGRGVVGGIWEVAMDCRPFYRLYIKPSSGDSEDEQLNPANSTSRVHVDPTLARWRYGLGPRAALSERGPCQL